jgi:hypothetical protein
MARKHNTKHRERGRSRYKARLTKRGLSKAPMLSDVDSLRREQRLSPEQAAETRKLSAKLDFDLPRSAMPSHRP